MKQHAERSTAPFAPVFLLQILKIFVDSEDGLIATLKQPKLTLGELNMSKRAFKRAVGRLLKEGAIKITDQGIETAWKDSKSK